MSRSSVRTFLVVLVAVVACRPPDAGRDHRLAGAYLAIVAAEDARPTGGHDLDVLLDGERDPNASIRAAAVRALGRLENPSMIEPIEPLLVDASATVRAEAANALAQAVSRGAGDSAAQPLLERVDAETDPYVRGVLARSLGRLTLEGVTRDSVARALVALSLEGGTEDAPSDQLVGAALGMESFARHARGREVDAALVTRLRALETYRGRATDDLPAGRVRELAVLALGSVGELGPDEIASALADPAVAVRRAAAATLPGVAAQYRETLLEGALGDPSDQVRVEAVRAIARGHLDGGACTRLQTIAAEDADTGVRLAALDALARPCPDLAEQVRQLASVAESLRPGDRLGWHQAAHALVALAHVNGERARQLLPAFAAHADPFVRMYAARAAGAARDGGTLHALTDDSVPNVRTDAVQQLATVEGRDADTLLIRELAVADDPQLVLTTSNLLAETSLNGEATRTALGTIDRLSRAGQETLRDARLALFDLVEKTGDERLTPRVEPYLADYDPAVAERAAAVLASWTGRSYAPAPRPMARLAPPTAEELRAMGRARVVLHMARGGAIEIRLLPMVAPTNALRLYRQAKSGTLDGLTFHRVVPDFVIQGGSPDANEYSGHGAFTRDELGLPVHWRGTVGLSTRGRDTGDGQVYVNLVDNVRLDHDYTVLGVVTSGMDVVDAVLEGDVIERAEVRPEG
ncbi:MAG: HEAT repeat domain-containing protein [Gemmatimonadetes bacterium]|nr:HEAT repeat domain-containing protein [Gemmatimonadota bacterium]